MTLSRLAVRRSQWLAAAPLYDRAKAHVYTLPEDPVSRVRPNFDLSMILLVLSSVSVLVYESYEHLGAFG